MRKYILSLLLLFLVSCAAMAQNTRHYSMQGIMGDGINFRLDLEEDIYNKIVIGQTTYYRKNGKVATIKVYGTSAEAKYAEGNPHILDLCEYNGSKVCGCITIYVDRSNRFVEGTWSLGEKELEMHDVVNLSVANAATYMHPVDVLQTQGVYAYSRDMGDTGTSEFWGMLQMYVQRKNIAYSVNTQSRNLASYENRTSEFFGNFFYFTVGEQQYQLLAYDGVIFIIRIHDTGKMNTEFGFGADIVGTYIKTNAPLRGKILKAFDEEEDFSTTFLPCSVFELNEAWYDALQGETTFPDDVIVHQYDENAGWVFFCRYDPHRTDGYEVSGQRSAVFIYKDGKFTLVAKAEGDNEQISVADRYIIKSTRDAEGSITHDYSRIYNGNVVQRATMIEADKNQYFIDGDPVKERDFKKLVKYKERARLKDLDDWVTIPGNQERNENAARG